MHRQVRRHRERLLEHRADLLAVEPRPLSVAVFGSRRLIDAVWVVLAGTGIALITPWAAGNGVDPLGVALAFAATQGAFAHLAAGRFAAGVGIALLSSAIPYTLEMIALKALPARTFGILMSLEPAVAALVGLAFLREVLSPTQWLAVALVIAASAGSTLTSRSAPEPPAADAP